MKPFLLLFISFFSISFCNAQHANRYYFIEFSTVYKSGLVAKASDLFFVKDKNVQDSFGLEDYFFELARGKVVSYNNLLDTLANTYDLFYVNFSKDSLGTYAENVFNRHSYFAREYLIKIDPARNMGPVEAILIKVFSRRIEYLDYKIIRSDCPYFKGDCAIQIRSIILKDSK